MCVCVYEIKKLSFSYFLKIEWRDFSRFILFFFVVLINFHVSASVCVYFKIQNSPETKQVIFSREN